MILYKPLWQQRIHQVANTGDTAEGLMTAFNLKKPPVSDLSGQGGQTVKVK
jgi:hypothetical protein